DGSLRFPEAIPERLGLRLSKHLENHPDKARALRGALERQAASSVEGETAALEAHLKAAAEVRPSTSSTAQELRSHSAGAGLTVKSADKKIVITGALASHGLAAAIVEWLKERHE
ncbi:MAG: hypothetical protein AAFO58_09920, partial [Pseudomonadota bacterium]